MKVIHLLPALEQGGVESVVLAMNRLLVKNGCESVVVSQGGSLVERIESDGGRHIRLDLKSKNPLTVPARVLRLRRVLAAEASSSESAVVCAHSRVPAWLFRFANRALGLRWITYAHGANSVSRYSEIMTKGDLTVVPSQFLADYLLANYPIAREKLRVIANPVATERFNPAQLDQVALDRFRREWGIAADTRVVMSVGRLTPLKGFDNLIRTAAELKREFSDFKLVIVGGTEKRREEYAASLRRLVDELNLADTVVFAGSQSQLAECLSLADVVVSGNVTKPESFGLSIVEAQLMGRAVVAKRFGGAAELIADGETGLLVDDADGFLPAIRRVLKGEWSPVADLRNRALNRFDEAHYLAATLKVLKTTL